MKHVYISTDKKRKTRHLPTAGNYLVTESDGRLRWSKPNDGWRVISNSGNQFHLISNIRYDDTEHSPDLWIYSPFKKDDDGTDRLIAVADNKHYLDRTRKWYIRQFIDNPDRIGIKRFTGLPLNAWQMMWRKSIPLSDLEIYGLPNNQMKVLYAGLKFNVFLKWDDLQTDTGESETLFTRDGVRWFVSQQVMPWLTNNCRGGITLFSDYDSMFIDPTDEFTYNIDVAGLS